MKTVNATITSKNQLTLPAKIVRRYGFDKNRQVIITEKKGVIEIRPQPTLEERMQKHWDKFRRQQPNFKPLSDAELKQAIAESVAEGAAKGL